MTGVLITGGTGTFGRAFVPEMLNMQCDRVVILSRDELKQAEMERELSGHPDSHKLRFYLGDVRDRQRLEMAMHNITHIVHAAALKRIEKCEQDPIEAVQTNVMGTANVVHAALSRGSTTEHMLGLSTDKACNPVNLYGATKLTMERLILAANNLAGGRMSFSVLRYGNIFASRGSVVCIWADCLARGATEVPITDPDATRFFLRIEDAIKLVRHRLFNRPWGDLFFPVDMPAYRLGDLMTAMGAKPRRIKWNHWEKQHEEIFPGESSANARRMSVEELREEVRRL
jgi:UDP-N-acetylglucosamine 4,6-dehydratase/5-epimerase